MLCGLAAGCTESNPPTTGGKSTASQPTTVTANRPTTTDRSVTETGAIDRTNTGINIRDRDGAAKTPLDQNENKADLATTSNIRKRVVDTKLSIHAHNVKIITQDGKVTLRGPVNSEDEKRQIEEIAVAVAGAGQVDNQLEIRNE
ncbi:MAG: BON domain-containing protein [Planctomycetales bacterium]